MRFIYDNISFGYYGIAIIIFTIFTRLILLPSSIKQIKSQKHSVEMQKEIAQIQKLFKNDRQKLQEETQKIRAKHGMSAMGGCLPMLLQFPIIIALFAVVREPITYILGKPQAFIEGAFRAYSERGVEFIYNGNQQMQLMNEFAANPYVLDTIDGFSRADIINFNFLGINLGMVPEFRPEAIFANAALYLPLLLIPILAAVTTYLQTKLMNNQGGGAASGEPGAAGMMKGMSFLMPAMIAFFAFTVPASLGLYWIVGNIFQIGQQYVMKKFFVKDDKNDKNISDKDKIIEVKGKRV